jgi:hypothetical protein
VEVPDDVKASEGARSQAAKHTAAASKGDAGVTTGAVPARIAAPAAEKLGTSPGDTAKSTSNAYGWSSQMPSSSGRSSPSTHWVSLQPADEKGLSLEVSGSTPTGCSDCGSETGVKFVADVAVETALGVGMGGHAGKTLQGLSYIGAGVGIAKDWDSLKQKTPEELASYVAPDVLAHGITYIPGAAGVASGLGPQIAITGTLVGSYRFGEAYVAPAVSPWISDKLVDQFPGMFIPPSNTSS